MYAIVDIETTGSYAAANGITEVSVHVHDGHRVVERFETLLDPGQPIPSYIQTMTGITDAMVREAPPFEAVAERLFQILDGRVFVAHNVNFDYSFLHARLRDCGFQLRNKKLCTVRLSRSILPGLPSYSLGNLCRSLGIRIRSRHRAGGDAAATVELFEKLLALDKEDRIGKSLKRDSKESVLPPHVPKDHFDNLPYGPGVYYFLNAKEQVVYVGKAANIRYRVNSHFSNNSEGRQKQRFLQQVHAIRHQACGTELMAAILESAEIQKRWPPLNAAQKKKEDVFGIFSYEDLKGYHRLVIDRDRKGLHPHHRFHYLADGQALLRRLIREFGLCPKACGLQTDPGPCTGTEARTCACESGESANVYNQRVERAIRSLHGSPSFAIMDQGMNGDDRSCVLVIEGAFYGMGYVPKGMVAADTKSLLPYITPYRENSYIRNLVTGHAARFPEKVCPLSH